MKYLKTYEDRVEYKSLYEIGDYVRTDPMYFTDRTPRLGKIIEIDDGHKVPYLILLSSGYDMWIRPDMISRMMTDDEIEQYELESKSSKYNL